jgi:hypothetical protein
MNVIVSSDSARSKVFIGDSCSQGLSVISETENELQAPTPCQVQNRIRAQFSCERGATHPSESLAQNAP